MGVGDFGADAQIEIGRAAILDGEGVVAADADVKHVVTGRIHTRRIERAGAESGAGAAAMKADVAGIAAGGAQDGDISVNSPRGTFQRRLNRAAEEQSAGNVVGALIGKVEPAGGDRSAGVDVAIGSRSRIATDHAPYRQWVVQSSDIGHDEHRARIQFDSNWPAVGDPQA